MSLLPIQQTTLGQFLGLSGTAVGLVFGILALIPTDPFVSRNLSLGITLVVLSCCLIFYIAGLFVGYFITVFILNPVIRPRPVTSPV